MSGEERWRMRFERQCYLFICDYIVSLSSQVEHKGSRCILVPLTTYLLLVFLVADQGVDFASYPFVHPPSIRIYGTKRGTIRSVSSGHICI